MQSHIEFCILLADLDHTADIQIHACAALPSCLLMDQCLGEYLKIEDLDHQE